MNEKSVILEGDLEEYDIVEKKIDLSTEDFVQNFIDEDKRKLEESVNAAQSVYKQFGTSYDASLISGKKLELDVRTLKNFLNRNEIPIYNRVKVDKFLNKEAVRLSLKESRKDWKEFLFGDAGPDDFVAIGLIRCITFIPYCFYGLFLMLGIAGRRSIRVDWKHYGCCGSGYYSHDDSAYRKNVPVEVVQQALFIRESLNGKIYNNLCFEVSDFTRVKDRHIDPFLSVSISGSSEQFVIAHWDEPKFSIVGESR